MNWYIIIPVVIAVIALLVFLSRRNSKGERKFANRLKQYYPKYKKEDEGWYRKNEAVAKVL